MEGDKSIFDELRETGEAVGMYGVLSNHENHRRSVTAGSVKAMPKHISAMKKYNKSKTDKEKIRKKVIKCTIQGCKKCPPESSGFSPAECNLKNNNLFEAVNPITSTDHYSPFQEYGKENTRNGKPCPEKSNDDLKIHAKYARPNEFEIYKYYQNGETNVLRSSSHPWPQMKEYKVSDCSNKGCMGCLADNAGLKYEQMNNSSKLEKHIHNKISEVNSAEVLMKSTDTSLQEDHRDIGYGTPNDRLNSPVIKSAPVSEHRSSQDLQPEQIRLKMMNEGSLELRSLTLKTNPEKAHSQDIVRTISQTSSDRRKSTEKTIVDIEMNYPKLTKEQMKKTNFYSQPPAKLNWRCVFLLILLMFFLVVIGVIIFIIDLKEANWNKLFNEHDISENSELIIS